MVYVSLPIHPFLEPVTVTDACLLKLGVMSVCLLKMRVRSVWQQVKNK